MSPIRAIAERWCAGQGSSKMVPVQLSTQRVDNFLCFEHLAKTPQVAQVCCANAASVLGSQMTYQRSDDLFADNGIGESEYLLALPL